MNEAKNSISRNDLRSGKDLRNFRVKIGKESGKSDRLSLSSTLTTKYPLEVSAGQMPAFSIIRDAYNIIEGTGKGSIFYFLATLHLSGFRVFHSAEKARQFVIKNASSGADIDEKFRSKIKSESCLGLNIPAFVPSKIALQIAKGPRARLKKDGTPKDTSFTKENIKAEYMKTLAVGVEKNNASVMEGVNNLFDAISESLLKSFESWKDISTRKRDASVAIDDTIKSLSNDPSSCPSLAEVYDKTSKVDEFFVENCSVAFDPSSTHIDAGSSFDLHKIVARYLSLCSSVSINNLSEFSSDIQNYVMTSKSAAYSWLLNYGLDKLQDKSVDHCAIFMVPESRRHSMDALVEAASAIKPNPLLDVKYHNFRTSIGSKVNSWISNYMSRLEELGVLLTSVQNVSLHPVLDSDELDDLYGEAGFARDDIKKMIVAYNSSAKDALSSFEYIIGAKNGLTDDHILLLKTFQNASNNLAAGIASLKERMNKERGHIVGSNVVVYSPDVDALLSRSDEGWNSFWSVYDAVMERIPSINRISGGIDDVNNEIDVVAARFVETINESRDFVSRVVEYLASNGATPDPLAATAERELRSITKSDNASLENKQKSKQLAFRRIVNRIGKFAIKANPLIRDIVYEWFRVHKVFADDRLQRKFFFNKKGSLYVSPHSTGRHAGYDLGIDESQYRSIIDDVPNLISKCREASESSGNPESVISSISLELLWNSMLLEGLEGSVPSSIATPRLSKDGHRALQYHIETALDRDFVSDSIVRQINSFLQNSHRDTHPMLRRDSFYLRAKFQWMENNSFIYRPKNRPWNVPQRYFSTDSSIRSALESSYIKRHADGSIDPAETVRCLVTPRNYNFRSFPGIRQMLSQSPHDWHVAIPFHPDADANPLTQQNERAIFLQDKGKIIVSRPAHHSFRMIGTNAMKTAIENELCGNGGVNYDSNGAGSLTYLFDQEYKQVLSFENGKPVITISEGELRCTVAVPHIYKSTNTRPEISFGERIIAIDQGEYGIAYAVFNVKDIGNPHAEPIDTGVVPIPSINSLINKTKKYRKGGQPQNFKERFDSTMFNIRENVVGDVVSAICGLMEKYRGFPILEREVKNLESGSRQLSLVYKQVGAYFLKSKVNAHDLLRKSWWGGAEFWIHPYLQCSTTNKPLSLFPGTEVSACRTSQICSCCLGSVFEDIKALGNSKAPLSISDGRVAMPSGRTLLLHTYPHDPHGLIAHEARRRNERVQMTSVLHKPNGKISRKDLEYHIKRNLRRAPLSIQSNDTSQSRYFCVYEGCKYNKKYIHADVNAAINIGRRFLMSVFLRRSDVINEEVNAQTGQDCKQKSSTDEQSLHELDSVESDTKLEQITAQRPGISSQIEFSF